VETVPRISYILDQLREARNISSLDLKDRYWQIPQCQAKVYFSGK